ncbi:MAG: hypothetical protein ACK41T_11455 [Pseudobdellovibrio sp.]
MKIQNIFFLLAQVIFLNLVQASEQVGYFAATDQLIDRANCRYPVAKSIDQIKNYFSIEERRKTSFQKDQHVMGFNLKADFTFYIELLKLSIEKDPYVNFAADGVVDYDLTLAKKNCNQVVCIFKYIYGSESLAYKAMYLLHKFSFNISHVRYGSLSKISESEVDTILQTLEFVPPHLLPFEKNKKIEKIADKPKDYDFIYADNSIHLYPDWTKATSQKRMYTLFHEFAHNWAKTGLGDNLDDTQEWLSLTKWKKIPAGFSYAWKNSNLKDHSKWLSEYSRENAWEDFAEAVSAYRFNPQVLLSVSPERYEFIKRNIFGNIEFLDAARCTLNMTDREQEIENLAIKNLDKKIGYFDDKLFDFVTEKVRETISKKCGPILDKILAGDLNKGREFDKCFVDILRPTTPESYEWPFIDKINDKSRINFTKAKKVFIESYR